MLPSWNTPHPTSLREATFSHKGRRERRTVGDLSYLTYTAQGSATRGQIGRVSLV
jgi:hypothetical protein